VQVRIALKAHDLVSGGVYRDYFVAVLPQVAGYPIAGAVSFGGKAHHRYPAVFGEDFLNLAQGLPPENYIL
jgi:hypothetical protein